MTSWFDGRGPETFRPLVRSTTGPFAWFVRSRQTRARMPLKTWLTTRSSGPIGRSTTSATRLGSPRGLSASQGEWYLNAGAPDDLIPLPEQTPAPAVADADALEDAQELLRLVSELPEEERLAIRFFFLNERSIDETARLLDRSRSGTYAVLGRAKARLARWLLECGVSR